MRRVNYERWRLAATDKKELIVPQHPPDSYKCITKTKTKKILNIVKKKGTWEAQENFWDVFKTTNTTLCQVGGKKQAESHVTRVFSRNIKIVENI